VFIKPTLPRRVGPNISATVRAGEKLTGRLTGYDKPSEVEVELVRAESGVKTTKQARSTKVTSRPAATTGVFSLTVPRAAAPTLRGQRVRVEWLVRVSRGTLRAADQVAVRILPASGSRDGQLPVSYAPGTRPPMIRQLRHEHYLSMGMGAAFVAMWLTAAVVINTMDSDASAEATRYFTIGALVVALFPLAALYLATRTIWPKSIGGFEPKIDKPVASPGSTITVSSDSPWPDDLRFPCVETYHRTYLSGPSSTTLRPQDRTVGADPGPRVGHRRCLNRSSSLRREPKRLLPSDR
jgi:hypothetical protein